MHDAYVFWSAAARDAAYQLLMPTERARLHAHALDALEHLAPPEELAQHARLAQSADEPRPDLRARELALTRTAARDALGAGRYFDAARLCERWAQLCERGAPEFCEAKIGQASALSVLGRAAEAVENARRAIEAAREPADACNGWRALCEVLYLGGRYEESVQAGTQAAMLAEGQGDKWVHALCLHALLSPLRELGRRAESEAVSRRLNEVARSEPRALPTALSAAGHHCMSTGDAAGAVACFERTEAECRSVLTARQRVNNLLNLGQCYCRAGDARAAATLDQALALGGTLGDRAMLGQIQAALGVLAYESGRSKAAEAHLAEAQALAEEVGDDMMLAITLGNRGSVLFNSGHFDGALACYARAEEVNARLSRAHGCALNRMNRGVVLRAAGRTGEALTLLLEAAREFSALGARGPRVFALSECVTLLLDLGRHDQARTLQAEAEAAAEGLGEARVLAMLREGRARLLEIAGDADKACAELLAALEHYEQSGMPRPLDALRLRVLLGRLELARGRLAQAHDCCAIARQRATEAGATPQHPLPDVGALLANLDALERELPPLAAP